VEGEAMTNEQFQRLSHDLAATANAMVSLAETIRELREDLNVLASQPAVPAHELLEMEERKTSRGKQRRIQEALRDLGDVNVNDVGFKAPPLPVIPEAILKVAMAGDVEL
jgi:hypothetical protein